MINEVKYLGKLFKKDDDKIKVNSEDYIEKFNKEVEKNNKLDIELKTIKIELNEKDIN